MRLPATFRTTPFRLTLLFLALFAFAASAFLFYIYAVTAGEVTRRADAEISREMQALETIYRQGGATALNRALIERSTEAQPFLYLLTDKQGNRVTGTIAESPIEDPEATDKKTEFQITETDDNGAEIKRAARGLQHALPTGETLFVGADVAQSQEYVMKIVRALWGAGALVVVLGLLGGVLVSRNFSRSISGLNEVLTRVQAGDQKARAEVRGTGDEIDELAGGLNAMLDRQERSMGSLRHAGDAIAHDLRTPLTRLRTRLEVAILDVEAGRGDPVAGLAQALADADGLLATFNAVLAIARLQAAGEAPDQTPFDPAALAADVAELYEPLCEDKGLGFSLESVPGLSARGNQQFLAQALSNLLDNAIKYTPAGGAVTLRVRRRSSGEVEFSITDTGPGVPEADRARIVQRFVRLENSRNESGSGLGLSLVSAVAVAHGGRLEIDEGPGVVDGSGPGLRTALILPMAG
ncbi:MAG: sensor histidine kinase [Caulobacteraceae bacterium]